MLVMCFILLLYYAWPTLRSRLASRFSTQSPGCAQPLGFTTPR